MSYMLIIDSDFARNYIYNLLIFYVQNLCTLVILKLIWYLKENNVEGHYNTYKCHQSNLKIFKIRD